MRQLVTGFSGKIYSFNLWKTPEEKVTREQGKRGRGDGEKKNI